MNTQFTGHNIEITPAIRDYTEKKLKKLTANRDFITHIHVIFTVDKFVQTAEASVSVPGQTIHAKADSAEIYQSVDDLIDKLIRQVNKYREKQTEHR